MLVNNIILELLIINIYHIIIPIYNSDLDVFNIVIIPTVFDEIIFRFMLHDISEYFSMFLYIITTPHTNLNRGWKELYFISLCRTNTRKKYGICINVLISVGLELIYYYKVLWTDYNYFI